MIIIVAVVVADGDGLAVLIHVKAYFYATFKPKGCPPRRGTVTVAVAVALATGRRGRRSGRRTFLLRLASA